MTENNLDKNCVRDPLYIPLWEKQYLKLNEATAYYGIGKNTIRSLTDGPAADCVLWIGRTRYINRGKFGDFLAGTSVI